ncbi:hypothetical protein BDR26DRAFT_856832, partial [Obelidium mucronatum]
GQDTGTVNGTADGGTLSPTGQPPLLISSLDIAMLSLAGVQFSERGVSVFCRLRSMLLLSVLLFASTYHAFGDIFGIASSASLSLFQISFVWYIWYRCLNVIYAACSTPIVRIVVGFLSLSTILSVSHAIAAIYAPNLNQTFVAISAVFIEAIGLFVVVCAIKLLCRHTKTVTHIQENDQRRKGILHYKCISRFSLDSIARKVKLAARERKRLQKSYESTKSDHRSSRASAFSAIELVRPVKQKSEHSIPRISTSGMPRPIVSNNNASTVPSNTFLKTSAPDL